MSLHNEELHILCTYQWDDHIKEDQMGESCSRHERDKKYLQNINIDPEWKSKLVRPSRR